MADTTMTVFIMGILLFASCSSAVVEQVNNDFETNSAVERDVSANTDEENVMQYHDVSDDAESWTVEDFNRGIKVSKIRYEDGGYRCLVGSLDESKSTQPSEIGALPDTKPLISITSEVRTAAVHPVKDSSFLGKTASILCADTPVYWTERSFDNVTAADGRVDETSRSKRSSGSCSWCCNDETRCASRGSITVVGHWHRYTIGGRLWRCEKVCRWILFEPGAYSKPQSRGCWRERDVPDDCKGYTIPGWTLR